MGLEFPLEKPAPIPEEIKDSAEFIKAIQPNGAAADWAAQLPNVREIVEQDKMMQEQWGSRSPGAGGNTDRPSARRRYYAPCAISASGDTHGYANSFTAPP